MLSLPPKNMPTLDDIHALRAETPGCAHVTHLNNAGSSLPPRPVIDAIESYRHQEYLNGGYETAAARAAEIAGFYDAAAKLLRTKPRNIAFAGSATDAYNKALSSIPFQPGDVLLTTDDDYVSNQIAFLFLEKRMGVRLMRAAKTPEGGVDVASMASLMDRYHPKLVAVTHVPTNSGLIQPVEAIGKHCRERGIWYLVDACQPAGQLPLDVEAIGCDFLSATMRKFLRGPRGSGFLFASGRVLEAGLEPAFPDLHGAHWVAKNEYKIADSAIRFEYFEKPFDLVTGSRAAIEYALALGLESIEKRVTALADYARWQLAALPGVRVLDRGTRLCGIVTIWADGREPQFFQKQLHAAGINTSTAGRANALIDFDEKAVKWALRISPHYYNTKEEIDLLAELMGQILRAD
jgi:selenocysteine lyase/cysteine desulfurase